MRIVGLVLRLSRSEASFIDSGTLGFTSSLHIRHLQRLAISIFFRMFILFVRFGDQPRRRHGSFVTVEHRTGGNLQELSLFAETLSLLYRLWFEKLHAAEFV